MEKFMEIVNGVWTYLLANPILLYVCAGVLGLMVITIIALCIKKGVAKKKAKKAAKKAAARKAAEDKKVVEEAKAIVSAKKAEDAKAASRAKAEAIAREIEEEEAREAQEAAKKEKQAPAPVVTEKVEEPAPVEEKVEEAAPVVEEKVEEAAPVAEEKPVQKKAAAPKKTAKKAAPVKEEPAPVVEEKVEEAAPVVEEKPVQKKAAAPKKTAKKAEPVKEEPKQEPAKEETAVAQTAEVKKPNKRYSGKWIVSRLIVVDQKGEEVEETYFFELHASNGEKLLSSEEYTTILGAMKGIETHKANIARDNFRITTTKKGEFIFKLLSGKNTLLCTGENYSSRLRCEKAIESTKRFAETAYIDETRRDVYVNLPVEDDEDEPAVIDDSYVGKWIISSNKSNETEETFYFELFASNGEKLLTSEEYTSYVGAINGIQTHKANIEKGNFRIALTKRGDYIFKLLSGNGQLLCLGEHYKTKRRCESAVESVKRFAKSSDILTDSQIADAQ